VGWVESLYGMTVGLDTAPLIYFIEEEPRYLDLVRPFFEAISRGDIRAVTSMVTLLEVLVHPLRRGDSSLAARYRDILLNSEGVTTLPLTAEIAEEAAKLRAAFSLRTADAIQVATVIRGGASHLLTNDERLGSVTAATVLVLSELQTDGSRSDVSRL